MIFVVKIFLEYTLLVTESSHNLIYLLISLFQAVYKFQNSNIVRKY